MSRDTLEHGQSGQEKKCSWSNNLNADCIKNVEDQSEIIDEAAIKEHEQPCEESSAYEKLFLLLRDLPTKEAHDALDMIRQNDNYHDIIHEFLNVGLV